MDKRDTALFDDLQKDLGDIEVERERLLQKFLWRKKIAWPFGALATALFGSADIYLIADKSAGGQHNPFIFIYIVIFAGVYHWVTAPRRDYIKSYKEKIMPRLARAVNGLTYNPKGCIPIESILPSKIIPSYDKVESEDGFEGEHKGVRISFGETKLSEMRGSGKNRHRVTTFKGLVILLEMTKRKFYGHTIIVQDQGSIGTWMTEKTKGMKRANLVDPAFEEKFNVYTTDQVEARYLIDPVMIQKLTDLCGHYRGESMRASYFNSKMLVMISSKYNFFEPADITKPAVDIESLTMLRNEVDQILSMIDYLGLDEETGVSARSTI